MTKRPIAIYDLDDTLISGDSFRRIIMGQYRKSPRLLTLMIGRMLKLVSRSAFAQAAHRLTRSNFDIQAQVADALSRIHQDVRDDLNARKEAGVYIVLISASPDDYVSAIGEALGADHVKGSHWDDDGYAHLHGQGKLQYLDRKFPKVILIGFMEFRTVHLIWCSWNGVVTTRSMSQKNRYSSWLAWTRVRNTIY